MKQIVFLGLTIAVLGLGLAPAATASAAPADLRYPTWHAVRFGETLFSIGRLYGVDPWSISAANRLSDPNKIYAGQYLYIPAGSSYPTPGCGTSYVVRAGDTLASIGRAYGVSPWGIAAANGIYNLNTIYIGQRLFIPCR